jgi:hypothetical protein
MWQSEAATKPVGGTQGCFVAIERNDHTPTTGFMQR